MFLHQHQHRRQRRELSRRKIPAVLFKQPVGKVVDDFNLPIPTRPVELPRLDRIGERGLCVNVAAAGDGRRQVAVPVSGGLNPGAERRVEPQHSAAAKRDGHPPDGTFDPFGLVLKVERQRHTATVTGEIGGGVGFAPEKDPVAAEISVTATVVDDAVPELSRDDFSLAVPVSEVGRWRDGRIVEMEQPAGTLQQQGGRSKTHVDRQIRAEGELFADPVAGADHHLLRSASGVERGGIVTKLHLAGAVELRQSAELRRFGGVPIAGETEIDPPRGLAIRRSHVLPEQCAGGEHLIGQQSVAGAVTADPVAGHPAEPTERTAEGDPLPESLLTVAETGEFLRTLRGDAVEFPALPGGKRPAHGLFLFRQAASGIHPAAGHPADSLELPPQIGEVENAVVVIHFAECRRQPLIVFGGVAAGELLRHPAAQRGKFVSQHRHPDTMPGKVALIVEQPVDVPQNPIRTVDPGGGQPLPVHRCIERPEPETPPFTSAANLRFNPVFPRRKRQIQRINLPGTVPFAGESDQRLPVEREFPEPVALHFGRNRPGPGGIQFKGDGRAAPQLVAAGQFPDVEPTAGIRTYTLCRTIERDPPRRHPGNQRSLSDDRPIVFRPEFPDRPLLPQIGETGICRAEHPGETASAQFGLVEHLPPLVTDRAGNQLSVK